MSTIKELKEITKQKKELADRQKEIRAKLEESKEDRKTARKGQAEARKVVREDKAILRGITAKVYETFSEGSSDSIREMADELETVSSRLVSTMREFAKAAEALEDL